MWAYTLAVYFVPVIVATAAVYVAIAGTMYFLRESRIRAEEDG